MQRPSRPFGVTLAIIASVILFTLFPLAEVALLVSVRLHFSNMTLGGDGPEPIAMGADFLGIPDSKIVLQAVIAIVFLIIAVFAWRGRPSFMRFVLMLSCIGLTLYGILSVILGQLTEKSLEAGMSSLDSILNSLSLGQFFISALVTLYVVWYLNRGPARAFYRGYYLPFPSNNSTPDVIVPNSTSTST